MQILKRNVKWQKKQSTKQRRFYDNYEAVEGKGWSMEMHLHEAKNMTRNANRHTGLLRA
jgi:hypothetical protein